MATSVVQAAGLGVAVATGVIPTSSLCFRRGDHAVPFVHMAFICSSRRKLRVSVGLTPTATFGPVSSPARKPGNPRAGLDPTSNNQLKAALGKKL